MYQLENLYKNMYPELSKKVTLEGAYIELFSRPSWVDLQTLQIYRVYIGHANTQLIMDEYYNASIKFGYIRHNYEEIKSWEIKKYNIFVIMCYNML